MSKSSPDKDSQLNEAIIALNEKLSSTLGIGDKLDKVLFYGVTDAGKTGSIKDEYLIIAEAIDCDSELNTELDESVGGFKTRFKEKFKTFFDYGKTEIEVSTTHFKTKTVTIKKVEVDFVKKLEDAPPLFANLTAKKDKLTEEEKEELKKSPNMLVNSKAFTNNNNSFLKIINLKLREVEDSQDADKSEKRSLLIYKKNELLRIELPKKREETKLADAIKSIKEAVSTKLTSVDLSAFSKDNKSVIERINTTLENEDALAYLLRVQNNLKNIYDEVSLTADNSSSFIDENSSSSESSTRKIREKSALKTSLGNQERRIDMRIAVRDVESIFNDLINPKFSNDQKESLLALVTEYERAHEGPFFSPLGYKNFELPIRSGLTNTGYIPTVNLPADSKVGPFRHEAQGLFESYKKLQSESVKANQNALSALIGLDFHQGILSFTRKGDYLATSKSTFRKDLNSIMEAVARVGARTNKDYSPQIKDFQEFFRDIPSCSRADVLNQISSLMFRVFAKDGKFDTCIQGLKENPELLDLMNIDQAVLNNDSVKKVIQAELENKDLKKVKKEYDAKITAVRSNFVKFKNYSDRLELLSETTRSAELTSIEIMESYEKIEASPSLIDDLRGSLISRLDNIISNKDSTIVAPLEKPEIILVEEDEILAASSSEKEVPLNEKIAKIYEVLKSSIATASKTFEVQQADALSDLISKNLELATLRLNLIRDLRGSLMKTKIEVAQLDDISASVENLKSKKSTLTSLEGILSEVSTNNYSIVVTRKNGIKTAVEMPFISPDITNPDDQSLITQLRSTQERIEQLGYEVRQCEIIVENPDWIQDLKEAEEELSNTEKYRNQFDSFRNENDQLVVLLDNAKTSFTTNTDELTEQLTKVRSKLQGVVQKLDLEETDFIKPSLDQISKKASEKVSKKKEIADKEKKALLTRIDQKIEAEKSEASKTAEAKIIAQQDKEIRRLKGALEGRVSSSDSPEEALRISKAKIRELEQLLTKKSETTTEAGVLINGEELKALRDELSSTKNKLSEKDSTSALSEEELSLKQKVQDLESKIAKAAEAEALQEEISTLRSQLEELNLRTQENEARKTNEAKAIAETQLFSKEEDLRLSETKVVDLERQLKEVREELSEKTTRASEIELEKNELVSESKRLAEELQKALKDKKEVEAAPASSTAVDPTLAEKVNELAYQLENAAESLREKNEESVALQSIKASLEEKVGTLTKSLEDRATEDAFIKLNKKFNDEQNAVLELLEKNPELKQLLESKEAGLGETSHNVDALEQQELALNKKLSEQRTNLTSSNKELEAAKAKEEELKDSEDEKGKIELTSIRERRPILEAEIEAAKTEISKITENLKELTNSLGCASQDHYYKSNEALKFINQLYEIVREVRGTEITPKTSTNMPPPLRKKDREHEIIMNVPTDLSAEVIFDKKNNPVSLEIYAQKPGSKAAKEGKSDPTRRKTITHDQLDLQEGQKLHRSNFGKIIFDESAVIKDEAGKNIAISNPKTGEKMRSGIFNGADLKDSSFRGCVFKNVDFSEIKNIKTLKFAGCEFEGCTFPKGIDFDGKNFNYKKVTVSQKAKVAYSAAVESRSKEIEIDGVKIVEGAELRAVMEVMKGNSSEKGKKSTIVKAVQAATTEQDVKLERNITDLEIPPSKSPKPNAKATVRLSGKQNIQTAVLV